MTVLLQTQIIKKKQFPILSSYFTQGDLISVNWSTEPLNNLPMFDKQILPGVAHLYNNKLGISAVNISWPNIAASCVLKKQIRIKVFKIKYNYKAYGEKIISATPWVQQL